MTRDDRLRQIASELGDRELVWFGIRGTDAAPFLTIPQFTQSFAITGPLRAAKLTRSETLEELTRVRVDLDSYDIDFDSRPEVDTLRRYLLASMNRPVAMTTYRPSHFLSALTFVTSGSSSAIPEGRESTCRYLGLFKDRHLAFEHKPWVETELRDQLLEVGVKILPWRYVAFEDKRLVERLLERGPVILRPNRTSGGMGISLIQTSDDLSTRWAAEIASPAPPGFNDHFMGISEYVHPSVPINVGACVFDSTAITLHPASVQLIGIDGFTNRRFGYCGNDFAAIADLESAVLTQLDRATRLVGRWLASMGYRGAFGVDYLSTDDQLYFAEVNPRMQGSTALSASLAAETRHVDICLDHLAAFLDLPPAESLTLSDWLAELPPSSHLIRHQPPADSRGHPGRAEYLARVPAGVRPVLIPDDHISVEPGAVLCRYEFRRQITRTGFDLVSDVRGELNAEVPSVAPSGDIRAAVT